MLDVKKLIVEKKTKKEVRDLLDGRTIFLTFVRHAQSEANVRKHIVCGRWDVGLTSKGKAQAAKLSKRWEEENVYFDKVFCSTARRAKQTGVLSLGKCKATITEDLQEQSMGEWEGKHWKAVLEKSGTKGKELEDVGFAAPQGESMLDVRRRCARWLTEALKMPKSDEKREDWVIFSHAMTIKAMVSMLVLDDFQDVFSVPVSNCSLTRIYLHPKYVFVISLNDKEHLLKKIK